MKKNIAIIIIVGAAVLGFLGGVAYGKTKASSSLVSRRGATMGNFGGQGGRMTSEGFTTGTVVAKDDKSITIQMQGATGGSKIAFVDTATQVMKTIAETLSDVTTGETVLIAGTPNADGSINATSIQIRTATTNNATANKN